MGPHFLPSLGWLLLVMGVVMACLAGRRRLMFGVLLVSLGGMALWLGKGDARTVTRKLLVVAPAGEYQKPPYQDLLRRLSDEQRKMDLALLLLKTGAGADKPATWKRAGELNPQADAGLVHLPADGWEAVLARAVQESIGKQDNVTVAFDLEGLDNSQFTQLKLDNAAGLLAEEFAGRGVTKGDDRNNTGFATIEEIGRNFRPLRVELSRMRFAEHQLNNYNARARVRVEGNFPPGHKWPGANGQVVLHSLVGGAGTPLQRSSAPVTLDWPEGEQEFFEIHFSKFTDANFKPAIGWHYLEVSFTTKDAGSPYVMRGGAFLEVVSSTLTVVQTDSSQGPTTAAPEARGAGLLADEGWIAEEGPGPPPTVEQLHETYTEAERKWREDTFSTQNYSTWSEFLNQLGNGTPSTAPGVTVLIEPNQSQIDKLADSQAFTRRLRDGEQVLICGFSGPISKAPPWLPAVPELKTWAPATMPQLLKYNWQARLDLMLDGSGVLIGGVGHDSYQSQVKFANGVIKRLGLKSPQGGVPEAEVRDADFLVPSWKTGTWAIAVGGANRENIVFRSPWTLANEMSFRETRKPAYMGPLWATEKTKIAALMIEPSLLARRVPLLDLEIAPPSMGDNPAVMHWKRLEPAVVQPRTRVVFLTADIGQAEGKVPVEAGKEFIHLAGISTSVPSASAPSVPVTVPAPSSVQSLIDRRIRVDLIPVEIPRDGPGSLVRASLNAAEHLSAPAGANLFPEVLSPNRAEALAIKYVDDLKVGWNAEPILHIRQHGRVFDPRVVQDRRAPLRHLVLKCPDGRTAAGFLDDTYAEVRETMEGAGPTMPIVVASPYGEGFVTVLGYSPFAGDMWTQDAGLGVGMLASSSGPPREVYPYRRAVKPRRLFDHRGNETERYDGWGIQRIVDPSVLGLGADPSGSSPKVQAVEWLAGDAKLIIHGWLPRNLRTLKGGSFSPPKLVIDGQFLPLEVRHLDLDGGAAQFSAGLHKSPKAGWGQIDWGGNQLLLVIPPVDYQAGALKQALGQFAMTAGEGQLDRQDIARLTKRVEPRSYAGLLWLLGAMALVFSPLARPWTAFYLWLKNRSKKRRHEAYQPPSSGIAVHAEATSNDWGRSRGQAKAIVQSGLPGGERPFEPGDTLSAARMVSLSFLALSHLPPQKPTMRLKHITMLRRAWVLVDIPSRLGSPYMDRNPNRGQYAELLVGVIAAIVLPTGAEIVLRWARPAGNERQLAIKTPGDLAGVGAFFASYSARHEFSAPELVSPDELVSGEDMFLLSDLRTLGFPEVKRFIDAVTDADSALVICALRSLADCELTGLVVDGTTGRLFDRTEFRPRELSRADRAHENSLKSYATARGGQVIPFQTHLSPADAFSLLEQSRASRS